MFRVSYRPTSGKKNTALRLFQNIGGKNQHSFNKRNSVLATDFGWFCKPQRWVLKLKALSTPPPLFFSNSFKLLERSLAGREEKSRRPGREIVFRLCAV